MADQTVTTIPSLGPIYAKAALPGKAFGKDLPDTRLRLTGHTVDRLDLLRYQRICEFNNSDVLPHTYPHVVGFPLQMQLMSAKAFPLPLMGLVHVENVITVHREIRFDEELDIAVSAENLRAHPKGKVVDLVTRSEERRVGEEGRSRSSPARGSGGAGLGGALDVPRPWPR